MSITTFVDLIAAPKSEKVFLVEIEPRLEVKEWTLHGGDIYKTDAGSTDVQSVAEDGSDLTEVSALADVSAGEWFRQGTWLYVQATAGKPHDKDMVVLLKLYFSDATDRIFNEVFYEPYLLSVPGIRQSKKDMYWGVSIMNSGALSLGNDDGHFDNIYDNYSWENCDITILCGGEDLPYGEYEDMFRGRVSKTHLSTRMFDLAFTDKKALWDDPIPVNTFSTTVYPALHSEDSGKPIPLVYGTVYRVPSMCITRANGTATNTHTFKQADTTDHGIQEITQVYVNGVAVGRSATSLASAVFSLPTSTYTPGDEVSADLKGYQSGTVLIENPVDVVKKISNDVLGIDYAAEWDTATTLSARGDATVYPIGLALTEFRPAIDVVGEIMLSIMGNFYVNNSGKYAISVWDTDNPAEPDEIDEYDVLEKSFHARTKIADIRKTVRIGWRKNWTEAKHSYRTVSNADTERVYGITKTRTIRTLLSSELGASTYASRAALLARSSTIIMSFSSKLQLARKNIGDRFSLSFRRKETDTYPSWLDSKMVDIREIEKDFRNATIEVTVDDLKGIGAGIGHWTEDDPQFPARYGGGSGAAWDAGWDASRKAYAKSHWGYWTHDSGFVDEDDEDSYFVSMWW